MIIRGALDSINFWYC